MPIKLLHFALLATALLPACSKRDTTAAATADAGTDAGADAGANANANASDVEPVYPIDPSAPTNAAAERLCAALYDVPEQKRAACCKSAPGIVVTSECVRTLSAALRAGAAELADADVAACAAAIDSTYAGCEWVGPFPPDPPPACLGIVTGKLAAGRACRSSLECAGALRCMGAGPTTGGKCAAVKRDGELCGGTVDALATYTRQVNVDARHPECAESCVKHRCAPRPPLKATGSCPAEGCPPGLACLGGTCAARRPSGAACRADFECRGGCLRGDAGVGGVCGPRCDVR